MCSTVRALEHIYNIIPVPLAHCAHLGLHEASILVAIGMHMDHH